ncbi:DUF916 and DUF3324 domain-containing protein [Lacticaseibacillus nasuensis]|uniref:DUF916 and DUF3324 domain-containing protein n=1 Tax=Lacticaseibacillus nasuensis TaxID=944671 RepID=UPI0022481304|nr:DUF916 and DUF3324 domain-containing protein [Lacticaseibacillus nasuensis]MCX2455125.1 DUF916 and DUF3324 domain-containing protein [Lacticaseibacillus nasuensis]
MTVRRLLFLLVLGGLWCGAPTPAQAAEQPGDYTVTPQLPENQLQTTKSYFDLLVKPHQRQTLTVTLTNTSKRPARFEVWANPALTSDNGAIDYSQRQASIDSTVPVDWRQAVTLAKHRYALVGGEKVTIPITLNLPATTFKGRVLGGLNVVKLTPRTKGQLTSRVGYTVAIVLQQHTAPVVPELKLLKAGAQAVNKRPTLQFKFRNPAATIIPNLKFHTTITRQGKTYIDNHANPYQVAPNTTFHLNLGLANHAIVPGTYQAKVVATSGKFFKRKFTRTFTISRQQAAAVNRNTIHATEPDHLWRNIAIGLVAVILLGGGGWWLYHRRQA